MSAETPKFAAYHSLVTQAEQHALLSSAGELFTTDATVHLVLAALDAVAAGLTRDEITTAITEGEKQGIVLYQNLQSRPYPAYWQAVREEAEAFWAKRYDPNALEDW